VIDGNSSRWIGDEYILMVTNVGACILGYIERFWSTSHPYIIQIVEDDCPLKIIHDAHGDVIGHKMIVTLNIP